MREILEMNLPRMLIGEELVVESVSKGTQLATIGAMSASFIIQTFFGFSLNMLWGCLNTIQMMVKLPLVSNIRYPASAKLFNDPLISIASFDFLDEFEVLSYFLTFPIDPL